MPKMLISSNRNNILEFRIPAPSQTHSQQQSRVSFVSDWSSSTHSNLDISSSQADMQPQTTVRVLTSSPVPRPGRHLKTSTPTPNDNLQPHLPLETTTTWLNSIQFINLDRESDNRFFSRYTQRYAGQKEIHESIAFQTRKSFYRVG